MNTKLKILLVSLILSFSAATNKVSAQLPAGSLSQDFTITDQFGLTHNLYNYLNQGYTVFVEISATWHGPSWNYFNTNALKNLYANHGPIGYPGVSAASSDDVMVIWIDGDGATTSADLAGTGPNTQGNWLNPTGVSPIQFPISNPATALANTINNDYAVGYYPTIYRVCPNRLVTEVGQLNDISLYSTVALCPPPAFQANDPSILSYVGDSTTCGNVNSAVVIQNNGTSPLTSCTMTVNGGDTPLSFNWTGNLATYAIDTVNLGMVYLSSPTTLNVAITSFDNNISNNSVNAPISFAADGTTHIKIEILFDRYPEESSWNIKDEAGNILASANYSISPIPADNSIKIENVYLPSTGCYTFSVIDEYGDGFYDMQWGASANGHIIITSLNPDGSVFSEFWSYDGTFNFSLQNIAMNISSSGEIFLGCNDPMACNYNVNDQSNASCQYPGCTNPSACNFNSIAACDDGSCFYNCGTGINCNQIFISEVVEGSSNNKAVEIYNPTNSTINLNGYGLARFSNGSSSYGSISYLNGYSILPHDVLVVVLDKQNPSGTGLEAPISPELQAVADVFINPTFDFGIWPMYFTGNDAIAIVTAGGSALVDLYGRVGEGPGFGGWSPYGTDATGNTLYATQDRTQVRENWVTRGVTTNPTSFDVFGQYDVLPINTFDNLGWHNCNCNTMVLGCSDPFACNYNPNEAGVSTCQYPGCTDPAACNFNPVAGCDNGSCHFTNATCNDNNASTMLDTYNSNCSCVGIPYSYGSFLSGTNTLCLEDSDYNISINDTPSGITNYSLQWYFKTGNNSAPTESSTSGWNLISGATSTSLTISPFTGTRTYACFVTPDASYGISGNWMSGAKVLTYSSFAAQTIIGNPNITPFNAYNYIVNPISGHTYNWTVTNGAVASGQGTNNVSIMWGQNGPYQLTLTESDGTCTGSSYLFAVNNNCSISVSAASASTNTFCAGTTLQLQAATSATGITYQWYLNGSLIPNETNQNISVSSGGNYQVSINQNGCTAVSNIVSITELPSAIIPSILVEQSNAGCAGGDATLTVSGGNYTNLVWNNGLTANSILVNTSGDYSITAIDENGCAVSAGPVAVNFSILDPVPVCIVTVDQVTGKNNIVWEPINSDLINSYVILKETNVANEYAQIGTVAYGSNGIFEDVNSDPQIQANRYKLALIDTCGILSSTSNFHKTIHLTANQGIGSNVNLIWSDYEGFDFGSYSIYRGSSASSLNLLTTIASNLNSFTDVNPPVGETYYMIEVAGVSCDPQRTLVYSHSNILDSTVGIEEFTSTRISLYPNPASTSITLQVSTPLIGEEYVVFDTVGKVIYKNIIQSTNELIHLENFNNGNYFVKVNEVVKRFVVQH